DGHLVADVGEDGRLEEVALPELRRPPTAAQHARPLRHRLLDLGLDLLSVRLADERAAVDVRTHGVAEAQRLRESDELLREFLERLLEDVEALARGADLPHVEERRPDGSTRRDVEVYVVA